MRKCALCPHDLRASLIRFQRCLGEYSRFGAINKANRLFEWKALYAIAPEIASNKGLAALNGRLAIARTRRCSRGQPTIRTTSHARFAEIFILAARFNVTRIIKFRAPRISIFETMRAAKRLPGSGGD